MSPLFDLSGRSIVITGATGALGRTAAITLGRLGAKLTLAAGSKDDLDAVGAEIRNSGGTSV